jgi:hypothetical protein
VSLAAYISVCILLLFQIIARNKFLSIAGISGLSSRKSQDDIVKDESFVDFYSWGEQVSLVLSSSFLLLSFPVFFG